MSRCDPGPEQIERGRAFRVSAQLPAVWSRNSLPISLSGITFGGESKTEIVEAIVNHSRIRILAVAVSLLMLACGAFAQSQSEVLSPDQVHKLAPSSFFFAGKSSSVQMRNTAGIKAGTNYVLAGLVDNSGYSSDIEAKYEGFLITEVSLNINGHQLAPGEYGFGFQGGKFGVMDVGNHDLLRVSSQKDEKMARPVPLKIVGMNGSYRLYAGRNWVEIKLQ